jgi:hypothetical protein
MALDDRRSRKACIRFLGRTALAITMPTSTAWNPIARADRLTGFRWMERSAGGGADNRSRAMGDVNGDGLANLLAGAPKERASHADAAGSSYVVFGRGQ